jgi:hypothetical protein
MNPPRAELLETLLRLDVPLMVVLDALRDFEWDHEEPLVILDKGIIKSILQKFLAGNLTGSELEAWANAIEGRDDIDYVDVRNVIHVLANPNLTSPLTLETVQDLLDLDEL